jgi:hypothetical protein
MDIDQALDVLQEIEDLLYAGSWWDRFRTCAVHEIWAEDVDNRFLEAFAKLSALGVLDRDLSRFINGRIKGKAREYYTQLLKTRQSNPRNSRVYAYLDVMRFIKQTQTLTRLLYKEICHIHTCSTYPIAEVALL